MLTIALLVLLAVALCGVAVAAVLAAAGQPRAHMAARVQDVSAYGYAAAAVPVAAGREHSARSVAAGLGDLLSRRVGAAAQDEMRTLLVAAGHYDTSVRALLGYRALAAGAVGALMFLLGSSPLLSVAFAAFGVLAGWRLTLAVLRRRAADRASAVELAVPDLIDQLVVTLEAGLGFSSSMQRCVSRMKGPLGDELRLALQEQRMGMSLTESLGHLRDRVESPNLRSFVRAVVQGERLGVSIGQVMRDLSVDMRKRRRQAAEERAQKTPTKLLFPVVFLILPAMFVVLLAPPLMNLANGL